MLNLPPKFWQHRNVLITGVCGTIGREILRQLVTVCRGQIIGIDNNETELFFVAEDYRAHPNVKLFIGDIRDPDKLQSASKGIDIILHTAALKHVILSEQSPRDPVLTNILGTQNVIDAAVANGVERVLFTSSDKAVNPTNVMGTSKLMGERLITAANAMRRGQSAPIFSSTRFGNVLGSRGSVVPLFKRQIAVGGPVTLTDPEMTRFIMTLQEAVRLVLESVRLAIGGEVFVTKMPVARIEDLAKVMIELLAPDPSKIRIDVIGSKPGEKLYEELMNEEEIRRTIELQDYFVITPAFASVYENVVYSYPGHRRTGIDKPYNSRMERPLSRDELKAYLLANRVLEGVD